MADQPADPGNDGSEPVYGPAAYGTRTPPPSVDPDAVSPPYTAPYPPYPYDPPAPQGISTPIASGLAYITVIPAVFFLLLEPYRSNSEVRFHSWQSILFFLAAAAIRLLERVIVAGAPALVGYTVSGLVSLLLFVVWLVAVIKALTGSRWQMPLIGPYAENIARSGRSL